MAIAKDARQALNLTQAAFAKLIGVSIPTVERWESEDPGGAAAAILKVIVADPAWTLAILTGQSAPKHAPAAATTAKRVTQVGRMPDYKYPLPGRQLEPGVKRPSPANYSSGFLKDKVEGEEEERPAQPPKEAFSGAGPPPTSWRDQRQAEADEAEEIRKWGKPL